MSQQLLGQILQVLAHFLSEAAESDGGEEIDRETRVARVIERKNSLKVRLHVLVLQARIQFGKSHKLCELLKENFDEDARGTRRVAFVEAYMLQNGP